MDIVERLRLDRPCISDVDCCGDICIEAADEIERLREALFTILCNTDPHAIRHRDYDHLAKNIFDCASAALKEKE